MASLAERILQAIADPVFVKDRRHRFVLVNDALCALAGHRREELLGGTDYDFFPREQADIYWAKDEEVFASGEVNVNDELLTDAAGTVHVIQTRKSRAVEPGGEMLLVGVIRDVTEAKRALAEAETRYRSLAENLNVLVYRADPATLRATYVNRFVEDLYGYSAEEWLRDPTLWERSIHPDDRERVLAEIPRALAASGEGRIEYRIVRRDGSVRWTVDRFTFEREQAGAPTALNGVRADVTGRVQAMERIAASDRAKSAFLAAMSHELKTPLNVILGFSDLLRDETAPTSVAHGYAGEIQTAGRRLLALLTDVLEFARLEEGGEALRPEATDIARALREAAAAHRAEAAQRGIALLLDAEAAGTARVDPGKLRQLVAQLLANALKFTPQGGRVTLRAARPAGGRSLEIAVEDTGIGIAPADREKLFKPFVQLDAALSRRYGGTGLGLALVRRIAELHGGEVSVQSEPGKGSVFTVRLPVEGHEADRSRAIGV
jgi:PAS domain S-box-containing protein